MNAKAKPTKHPVLKSRRTIHRVVSSRVVITVVITCLAITGIAALLWLLPAQPDPERIKFKTLYQDVDAISKSVHVDGMIWSNPKKECEYNATNLNPSGGWICTAQIYDVNNRSIEDLSAISRQILATSRFELVWEYDSDIRMTHVQSETTCDLRNGEYSEGQYRTTFLCTRISDKSWYPPNSMSTSETLPGTGAWKRLDN